MAECAPSIANCEEICDDCPKLNSLLVKRKEVADILGPCEAAEYDIAIDTLNKAAGEIACSTLDKDIPIPEERLPSDTAERIVYEKQCLAYSLYRELGGTL